MKLRYMLLLHNEIRLICILCVNSHVLASEFVGIFVACAVLREVRRPSGGVYLQYFTIRECKMCVH